MQIDAVIFYLFVAVIVLLPDHFRNKVLTVSNGVDD